MSYIRGGTTYIWSDEWSVHLWSEKGYDGWDESNWYQDAPPGKMSLAERDAAGSEVRASGVAIPHDAADSFVVMRFAELLEAGELGTVIARAVECCSGNAGFEALRRQKERLLEALQESHP